MLANATIGMSGADLENVCNEAALNTARHNRAEVTMTDFEAALDRLRLGAAHSKLSEPDEMRIVAYHEAGHTVVAWLSRGADPVQKVTVIPHGMTLGSTEQLPEKERRNLSAGYLKTRLAIMLGGRSAEEIVLGEVTTGSENDLVDATKLARRMVAAWGMSEIGLEAFASDGEQPFLGYELAQRHEYSEATAARIDAAVKQLLNEAHDAARRILTGARPQLDALAARLIKDETVSAPVLEQILGPRPKDSPAAASSNGEPVLT